MCSIEHMTAPFVFMIRPLSLEKGFELECEGIIRDPLRVQRLIEAVIAAVQIGQGLNAEVQILDTDGKTVETLKMDVAKTSELLAA
jgi:hypothetical protein